MINHLSDKSGFEEEMYEEAEDREIERLIGKKVNR